MFPLIDVSSNPFILLKIFISSCSALRFRFSFPKIRVLFPLPVIISPFITVPSEIVSLLSPPPKSILPFITVFIFSTLSFLNSISPASKISSSFLESPLIAIPSSSNPPFIIFYCRCIGIYYRAFYFISCS